MKHGRDENKDVEIQYVSIPLIRYEELLNKAFITESIINTDFHDIKNNPIIENVFLKHLSILKSNYLNTFGKKFLK